MPDGLRILFDTVQPRVKNSRNSLTVAGEEWDGPVYSETWLVPKVNCLACMPAPLRGEWHTSNSGSNQRWGLSDFGLSESDGWELHGTKDGVGKVRMCRKLGMAEPAKLSTTLLANQAVFLSYFPFNVGNDDARPHIDCGWGETANYLSGVSLRFWSGGKADVYKDGAYLATYTLGNGRGSQTANRYTDLLLAPMRGRELTVYSITNGDSFTHVFADIPENEESPVVTPEAPFWWYVPSLDPARPTAVDVEAAMVYWHGGYATSLPCALGRPPKAGAALESWANDAPFASIANGILYASAFPQAGSVSSIRLTEPDGATAFAPNGVKTDCLMRVDLVGGTHTPFVDAAHMAYKAEIVDTTPEGDEGFDVMPYVREATLRVPDSAEPAEIALTIGYPAQVEASVKKLLTVSNRPVRAYIGEQILMDGVQLPAKFHDGEHDGVRTVTVTIRDRMHTLREAAMRARMPLDGIDLCKEAGDDERYRSAVEFLYRFIGIPQTELDLDDVDHELPRVPSRDAKEFCHLLDVGCHPFDELDQLHQDQAATFLWGARPTAGGVRYLFKDPDGFSGTPDKIVYRSDEDAIAAGADPDAEVYYSYDDEPLETEANEVRAVGRDPRTGDVIQRFREDLDSKNPALAPSARPDNWLGEERVMGIANKRFARQLDLERVVDYVFPQVTARYFVGQWTCEMLFLADGAPVWRGHLVRLDGRRDLRVSSLEVKFWREPGDVEAEAVAFREASYTGGTLTNAGGVGLQEIRDAHAARAVNKTVRRPGSEIIERATARKVVEA